MLYMAIIVQCLLVVNKSLWPSVSKLRHYKCLLISLFQMVKVSLKLDNINSLVYNRRNKDCLIVENKFTYKKKYN